MHTPFEELTIIIEIFLINTKNCIVKDFDIVIVKLTIEFNGG